MRKQSYAINYTPRSHANPKAPEHTYTATTSASHPPYTMADPYVDRKAVNASYRPKSSVSPSKPLLPLSELTRPRP